MKFLNLDLVYGGIPFLCSEFIQIQNVIYQLVFEILENFFQLSTSLEYSFKHGIKNKEIQKFKIYIWMTSANVTS